MKKKLSDFLLISFCCTFVYLCLPKVLNAIDTDLGRNLFEHNCAGCHINGGNIVRRNRTLKLSALKRQGLDNPQAIAEIARKGIGSMSGYEEVLGEGEDQLVATWIWNKAQNAWTHG